MQTSAGRLATPWLGRIGQAALVLAPAAWALAAWDPRTRALLLNSLFLVTAVCLLAVPLGTGLALLLVRTDLPGRRWLAAVFASLLFIPLYLQAGAWQAGFGLQGWHTLGAENGIIWLEGWRGAIWVHALASLPWVMAIVAAGCWFVEPELEELALLSMPVPRVIWSVTLRRAAPAIAVATLWVAVMTAGEMTVTDLFLVRTYTEELFTQIATGTDLGETPLTVLPGIAVTCGLVAAAISLAQRVAQPPLPRVRARCTFALGRWRWLYALLVVLIALVVVGVPLGNLFWKAGVQVSLTAEGRVREWSAMHCWEMLLGRVMGGDGVARFPYWRYLSWSLRVAALATLTALAVAIPLAWHARRGGWRAVPMLLTLGLTMGMPGPVVGVSIMTLLNRPELPWLTELYDRSILPLWLAQTFRALPLTILILWHALRGIPEQILESARLDGILGPRQWWLIVLPQRWWAVAAAALTAFVWSMAELDASFLVAPPGIETLSIHVFNQLHFGAEDRVAGLCLVMWGSYCLLAMIFQRLVVPRLLRKAPQAS